MNRMVFELQPDIIVNNRNRLAGDFSTPEQRIEAERGGRAWESCMTLNDSWGYNSGRRRLEDAARPIVRNLATCAHDGGNYLLNIGPRADGSVPEPSVRTLEAVGRWMERNGDTIYKGRAVPGHRSHIAGFTRNGNTLYMHVHAWPGDESFGLGGLRNKVLSARLHATGQPVKFVQDAWRVKFTGMPAKAPDAPVTVIALELDGEPRQDLGRVRVERERTHV